MALALLLVPGLGLPACNAELEVVPEGALALVGNTVIWPQELDAVRTQLGGYGQRRFGQEGGGMALLEAAITQRLLELEAKRRGMELDPRVEWAVSEEMARLQLAAELERRVPERGVAEDVAALREYYDAHPDEFLLPEKRSANLIECEDVEQAEALIAELAAGETTWDALQPELAHTPLRVQDNKRFPLYHRHLFDPQLKVGDLLPTPVFGDPHVHVARVHEIVPAEPKPFDDARVQGQLVDAVRAPLLEAARVELMAELAERYPVRRAGG
jgi:hypothetical protein